MGMDCCACYDVWYRLFQNEEAVCLVVLQLMQDMNKMCHCGKRHLQFEKCVDRDSVYS